MSSKKLLGQVSVMDARTWYQLTTLDGVVASVDVVLTAYNNLLRELYSGHESVTHRRFETVMRHASELLVFMFDRNELIGTAQASLVFPGCHPIVWIEKVIVTKAYRGCGLGQRLMQETERLAATRFSCHLPLTIQLTSRAERNTEPFYRGLGYVPETTNRYKKKVSLSAP